jgi:hypothetical protein
MRRVLRYLDWLVKWWRDQVETRPDTSPQIQAGVRAYAVKQADLYTRIAAHFQDVWNKPTIRLTQRVLAGAPGKELEGADLDDFFEQLWQ